MRHLTAMLILGAFLLAGNVRAETFKVKHDHFWRSCTGVLVFGDHTVEYFDDHKKHSRSWKYQDIQQLAIAPGRISILTYHARKREFGADQAFHFTLLAGKLSEPFRQAVGGKLARPMVSGIVPETTAVRFNIPARHKMFLKSSQGILEFGEEYLVYRSGEGNDSRIWRYEELLSIGSTGPFQLRLGALQKTGGEYGEEKNYVFDLKRRMTAEEYDFIWEKVNRLHKRF